MFNAKSFRSTFFAALLAAPLVAACGGAEGDDFDAEQDADAITISQTGPLPISSCLIQAPDATMTAGPDANGYYFGHRSSGGIGYTSGGCSSYIVDIVVPGNYGVEVYGTLRRSINISAAIEGLNLTQSTCDNASERVRIYKKSQSVLTGSATSFATVSSENVASGTWVPFIDMGVDPFCQLTHPFKATAAGHPFTTDTYRVLVDNSYFGADQSARVSWTWTY